MYTQMHKLFEQSENLLIQRPKTWPCYFCNRQAKHEGRLLHFKISHQNLIFEFWFASTRMIWSKNRQNLNYPHDFLVVWRFSHICQCFDGMNLLHENANCLFWRSCEFIDITGRCASKNDPQGSEFQLSRRFGKGVKELVLIFWFLAKHE